VFHGKQTRYPLRRKGFVPTCGAWNTHAAGELRNHSLARGIDRAKSRGDGRAGRPHRRLDWPCVLCPLMAWAGGPPAFERGNSPIYGTPSFPRLVRGRRYGKALVHWALPSIPRPEPEPSDGPRQDMRGVRPSRSCRSTGHRPAGRSHSSNIFPRSLRSRTAHSFGR